VRESAGRESDGLGVGDWLSLVCYELFVVVVDVQIGEVETCGMWGYFPRMSRREEGGKDVEDWVVAGESTSFFYNLCFGFELRFSNSFINASTWTFSFGSHELSLTGYPFHLTR